MVLQMRKGILDSEKAEVTFPATLAKVQTEMRGLEEFGKSYGVVRSVSGKGPAQLLNGRVQVDDLNTEAGIQRLNRLAEVIDNMSSEKLELLSGALALERAANLDDVLRVTDSLEQYDLFPQIRTDEDLGHFLAPTTTFWKTDVILKEEEMDRFVKEYKGAVKGRFDVSGLEERLKAFVPVTCLRGITWCAMAWVEYQKPGRLIRNGETFRKMEDYLDGEFLRMIENKTLKTF